MREWAASLVASWVADLGAAVQDFLDMDFFQAYYRSQFVCQVGWWGLVYGLSGRWVYELSDASVVTSPAWLVGPPGLEVGNVMLWLHRRRRVVFLAMPYMLGVAAYGDNSAYFFPRYVAALAVAAYHATETALSRRHGEYPLLYSAWACCLPADWARGACLGAAAHFVLSAGVAKVAVGGPGWCRPRTMRTYLAAYRRSSSALTRPLSARLSAMIGETRLAAVAAACTVALECVCAPLALVVPPHMRAWMAFALVGMHVGIAVAMSAQVGLAFLTALPSYACGFCSGPLPLGPWLLACLVGLGPTARALVTGTPAPETWPLSPFALFALEGAAADALAAATMTGDTRLVLATRDAAARDLVGAKVRYAFAPGRTTGATGVEVHDAVLRAVGFTVFPSRSVARLLAAAPPLDPAALVRETERWLQDERTLAETATGHRLARAFFVRVADDRSTVAAVLVGDARGGRQPR